MQRIVPAKRLFLHPFPQINHSYHTMNNKKTPFPPKQKQQSLSSSANKAKGAKSFASPTWLAKPEIDLAVKSNKAAYGYFHSARRDVGFVRLSSDARDVFIDGVEARNRAMDGDYVVVEFLPPNASPTKPPLPAAILQFAPPNLTAESNDALWAPKINFPPAAAAPPSPVVVVQQQPQQCGKIVSVVNKDTLVPIRQRETDKEWIGTLNPPPGVVVTNESGRLNASVGYCFFENNDQRFPSLVIQRNNLPFEFVENPESCRNVLYRAKFASWPEDRKFPFGEVVGKIGTRGEIHSETAALLLANKVNTEGFSEEALKCITQHQNGPIWEIPQEEFAKRRDLRNELIFTIDPLTAKDIDDALHCKQIGEGLFEVGVHIADVSHFVPENSAIDAEAQERSTSVYLVQKCLPMLPPILSEELCSLNPHVDRLAFSVIWVMNTNGELVSTYPTWFGKTVIRSDCKLDYGLAQEIHDGTGKWTCEDKSRLPQRFTPKDVYTSLRNMVKIGMARRELRFEPERGGAIQLTQSTVKFDLDPDTGNPVRVRPYPIHQTNQLVEEFMLICNFLVAQELLEKRPDKAFVRFHPPPDSNSLGDSFKMLKVKPTEVSSSSGGISAASLQTYLTKVEKETKNKNIILVVRELLKKPMKLAKYVNSGSVEEPNGLRHWALNIRYYTHFTSPIRRYADLIVHRQLFAILEQSEDTTSKKRYDEIASHCNIKKELAQKASEESNEVFLNLYIQRQFDLETPFHAIGVAVEFGEVSFQVLLPEFGISKRVHIENELGWKVVRVIRSSEVDNSSEGGAVVERLQVETKSGEVKEIAFLTELHLALIPAGIAGKLSYKMVAFDEVPKKDKA